MRARLTGYSDVAFTDNSGREVRGTNIFILYEEEHTVGLRAEKVFLKEGVTLPEGTQVNDVIDLFFNMRGKVERIEKVEKAK